MGSQSTNKCSRYFVSCYNAKISWNDKLICGDQDFKKQDITYMVSAIDESTTYGEFFVQFERRLRPNQVDDIFHDLGGKSVNKDTFEKDGGEGAARAVQRINTQKRSGSKVYEWGVIPVDVQRKFENDEGSSSQQTQEEYDSKIFEALKKSIETCDSRVDKVDTRLDDVEYKVEDIGGQFSGKLDDIEKQFSSGLSNNSEQINQLNSKIAILSEELQKKQGVIDTLVQDLERKRCAHNFTHQDLKRKSDECEKIRSERERILAMPHSVLEGITDIKHRLTDLETSSKRRFTASVKKQDVIRGILNDTQSPKREDIDESLIQEYERRIEKLEETNELLADENVLVHLDLESTRKDLLRAEQDKQDLLSKANAWDKNEALLADMMIQEACLDQSYFRVLKLPVLEILKNLAKLAEVDVKDSDDPKQLRKRILLKTHTDKGIHYEEKKKLYYRITQKINEMSF